MKRTIPTLLLLIATCILSAGCMDQHNVQPAATTTPTLIPTNTPEPVSPEVTPLQPEQTMMPDIFDQPVTHPPDNISVSVSVRKDPVYSLITATFDGGKGQDLVRTVRVKTTQSTGNVTIQDLKQEKGAEIVLNGTRGADRVQVAVMYMNGNSYQISDTMLDPSRAGTAGGTPVPQKTMSINEEGLYPGPVTIPPNSLSVTFDVQKEPIYRVITGTFRGGHGQSLVSRIDMNAILSDGTPVKKQIAGDIGATGEIQGTDGVDRVQIVVSFKNGETYKVVEKAFGSRGESFT